MKTAKQLFREDKERAQTQRHSFSERTTGPTEVMREVTAETIKKIEAIFEQVPAKDPKHGE